MTQAGFQTANRGHCIFCLRTFSKMQGERSSAEHYWGRWLQDEIYYEPDVPRFPHYEIRRGSREPIRSGPFETGGHFLTKTLKGVVCERCNSGWMSVVQNRARLVYKHLAGIHPGGEYFRILSDTQAHALASWVGLKVVLHSAAYNRPGAVSVQARQPFFNFFAGIDSLKEFDSLAKEELYCDFRFVQDSLNVPCGVNYISQTFISNSEMIELPLAHHHIGYLSFISAARRNISFVDLLRSAGALDLNEWRTGPWRAPMLRSPAHAEHSMLAMAESILRREAKDNPTGEALSSNWQRPTDGDSPTEWHLSSIATPLVNLEEYTARARRRMKN